MAKRRRRRKKRTKKNPMGIPWWGWVGGAALGLYLLTRSKAANALMPANVAQLSVLQDALSAELATALGMKKEDLIINIGGAAGPVTIVDRRNNNVVLKTAKSPDTLLNFAKADGLSKYYTDPFGQTSLYEHGWIATAISV